MVEVLVMKIIMARIGRFFHSLWWGLRPWRWNKVVCQSVTHYDVTPGKYGITLIACTCKKEWYRRPGYDETELVSVHRLNKLVDEYQKSKKGTND
jgi:hypothetical protein